MDQDEFQKAYWVLRPKLLRYARGFLDSDGAEDVVTDALVDIWRKNVNLLPSDAASRELEVFAYGKLRGHISNQYRSRRRRAALTEKLAREQACREALPHQDEATDALVMEHWLGQLDPDDRGLLLLYNAGFTAREMGDILGCTPPTAGKRVTRARERLRAIVERERGLDA